MCYRERAADRASESGGVFAASIALAFVLVMAGVKVVVDKRTYRSCAGLWMIMLAVAAIISYSFAVVDFTAYRKLGDADMVRTGVPGCIFFHLTSRRTPQREAGLKNLGPSTRT